MKIDNLLPIIKQATKGDPDAFVELCEAKAKDILFLAIHLMGNKQDGEDAAQDAILYLQQHITKLKEPGAFSVWMYRIVVSTCNQMRRKRKNKIHEPIEPHEIKLQEERKEFLPYEYVEDTQKKELLLKAIDDLPHPCKMCILLFYYEGMSYADIASVLKITAKQVDNALVKAKKLILRSLERKADNKVLLQNAYAAAPLPVLTQVFESQVPTLVSNEALSTLIGTGKTAAATAGTTGVATTGMSVATKITAGILVSAAAATGVYAGVSNASPPAQDIPAPPAEIREEPLPDYNQILETSEPEAEPIINTLEDMIGMENADRLRTYVSQESNSAEDVMNFLLGLGMATDIRLETMNEGESYISYYLTKQSKMLTVIERENSTDQSAGVSFLFTDADMPLLEDGQLIVNYSKWK